MRRIAHLSDLHFGRVDPTLVEALLTELNDDPPDLIAVSGDLTQRARTDEFRAARAFLDRLAAPVLAVPGNHDITAYKLIERFLDPLGRWHRYVADTAEPVWRDDEIAVLGLNTASRGGPHLDWSRGRVRRRALRRLVTGLQALPTHLFRIVVAHHPFLPPAGSPATPVVGGAAAALAAFAAEGVGLLLSGHLHLGSVRQQAGGPLLVVQAATATSTRLRGEPNAYNAITIAEGRAEVQARSWDGERWHAAPPNLAAIGPHLAQPNSGPPTA